MPRLAGGPGYTSVYRCLAMLRRLSCLSNLEDYVSAIRARAGRPFRWCCDGMTPTDRRVLWNASRGSRGMIE